MIRRITLNQFLEIEVTCCFVCGNKKYIEFYKNDHLFRICSACLKLPKVKEHLKKLGKNNL